MIVFFTEQDLVSFGNFLLSPERAKPYLENDIIKDKADDFLKQVNNYDLQVWAAKNSAPQQPMQPEKPQTIEEIPVDEDANTLNTEG